MAFPAWLACIVQFPSVNSNAVEAEVETEHIVGVVDVNVTCSSELAVAIKAGVELRLWVEIEAKVMACEVFPVAAALS
jgi:hypothetical protein